MRISHTHIIKWALGAMPGSIQKGRGPNTAASWIDPSLARTHLMMTRAACCETLLCKRGLTLLAPAWVERNGSKRTALALASQFVYVCTYIHSSVCIQLYGRPNTYGLGYVALYYIPSRAEGGGSLRDSGPSSYCAVKYINA